MNKILIVSGFWPLQDNVSSGNFVVDQVRELSNKDFLIEVILLKPIWQKINYLTTDELCLDKNKVLIREIKAIRIPNIFNSEKILFNVNKLLLKISFSLGMRSYSRGFNICIIHNCRYELFYSSDYLNKIGLDFVVLFHGIEPLLEKISLVSNKIFKRYFLAATKIIIVGRMLKQHLLRLGAIEEKIQFIPNGIPSFTFRNLPFEVSNNENLRIVSISNLIDIKGIDDNIMALSLIKKRAPCISFEYIIIGDGVKRMYLETLCRDLEIDDYVIFKGKLNHFDAMSWLNSADIFSMPSWKEAFGLVYLEAMLLGKPTIGCYKNGASDIITDKIDGFLINPRDINSLSETIEALLVNKVLRESIGLQATITAQKYTIAENLEMILSNFERVE